MLKSNSDFRYLWLGRIISNAGDSIYLIVLSWYIVNITEDAFWLGFLHFSIFLPTIFQFVFGPTIDRTNKKTALIICEFGQMISILIIAGIILLDFNFPLLICLFAFTAAAFGMNTYTIQDVLMTRILAKRDWVKGRSYMSVAYMGSEYLFNALTGFLMKFFSIATLLIVDVLTFLLSILAFKKIKYDDNENLMVDNQEKVSVFSSFRIIFSNTPILILTLAASLANFMFGGFNVYVILIANDQNSPVLYGMLLATMSVATLFGSTFLVNFLGKWFIFGKVFVYSSILFGVFIFISGFVTENHFIFIPFFLSFMFLGVTQVINTVYFQTLLKGNNLGTVLSGVDTLSVGSLPLGALFFGAIGNILPSSLFLFIFGLTYTCIGIIYLLNKTICNLNTKDEIETV